MKVLKIFGGLLGLILIIVVAGYLYINSRGIPTYPVEEIQFEHTSSPEILERGEKLVSILCAGCHRDPETGLLTGTLMAEAPPIFGEIYSKNITQDDETGIGQWTDAQLLYLLRTGITPSGQYIPPYMAKLTVMADEDVNAIIAFLRSDHSLVAAVNKADKNSKPSFFTKFLCNVAWKPMDFPEEEIPMPDSSNLEETGKYLALNLECFSCHSGSFKTNDYANPENSKGFFGGGNSMLDIDMNPILSSNLTPHSTGIGDWTEEQFVKALRFGIVDGQPALRYPMMPYSRLTDREAKAIFTYLQTIEPIDNKVERPSL